jgi:hypothetical protein
MIGGRKISTSYIVLIACVLGVGIGLFGINYWHATKCTSDKSPQDYEDMISALNRRLLEAESQVHRNEILVGKVIKALETNLYRLGKKEFEELSQRSKDDAVKAALYLSTHPAPTFPEYPLDAEYGENMEEVADILDDVYNQVKDNDKMMKRSEEFDDKEGDLTGVMDIGVTDADAIKLCSEWKDKYNVVVGVSWGNLPYDLQQNWLKYSCDYHLQADGKPPSKESANVKNM